MLERISVVDGIKHRKKNRKIMLGDNPIRVISHLQPNSAGLTPILGAVAASQDGAAPQGIPMASVEQAFETGLGPYVAELAGSSLQNSPVGAKLLAASLTAQLLTSQMLDALEDVLRDANASGYRPLLLKGAATCQLYYSAPHLRTMGDIDLYVTTAQQSSLEANLTGSGYHQKSHRPPEFFAKHHHSMPFWHPARRVWIEIHTRLFPPWSPHMKNAIFRPENLEPNLRIIDFRGQSALVMSHEMQLIYTAARWTESLDLRRGIFPLLDILLLLATQSGGLCWDTILSMLKNTPTASSVRLVFELFVRLGLADVPLEIRKNLSRADSYTNRFTQALLQRMAASFLLGRRPFGRIATHGNIRTVWSTLLGTHSPLRNLITVPYNMLFPPGNPRRFDILFALGRLASLLRHRT